MSNRKQILLKRLLTALNEMDNVLMVDTILHAEVGLNITPSVSMTEFEDLIRYADSQLWLNTSINRVTGKVKYGITDEGRVALNEL
jgi:hypothetical protein